MKEHFENSIGFHLNLVLNQVNILKKENEILKNVLQMDIQNDEIVLKNDSNLNLPLKYLWNFKLNSNEQISPNFLLKGSLWNFSVIYKKEIFHISLNLIKDNHCNDNQHHIFDVTWGVQIENVSKTKSKSKQFLFKFDLKQNSKKTICSKFSMNDLKNENYLDQNNEICFKFIFTKFQKFLIQNQSTTSATVPRTRRLALFNQSSDSESDHNSNVYSNFENYILSDDSDLDIGL